MTGMTDPDRLRQAIEAEYGPLTDLAYIDLISAELLAKRNTRALEKANEPMFRVPTTAEDYKRVVKLYPKSVESVVRELSIYGLVAKSDGQLIQGNMVWGIAIAIVDHILKAGELA